MCLVNVWVHGKKTWLAQNPQVSVNFLHFITVAPFIQVHIILNASIFHIIFFFVLFLGWTCGVEVAGGETWNENINCSCHGCRLRNLFFCFVFLFLLLFFFLHLTKKTGLQVHPTTDMQFTESREEEKLNRVTRGAPPLFVSATVWQVLGGKQRPVSVGWNWNAGRWMMDGWMMDDGWMDGWWTDDGWMHGWMVGVSKYIR